MDLQQIIGQVFVPLTAGLLAGTYVRVTLKFVVALILLVVVGIAFAIVPVDVSTLTAFQGGTRMAFAAVTQVAPHVPVTALGGFLLGWFVDRVRGRRS